MSIKYTVTKQLNGGTNIVFEGEASSTSQAIRDVTELNLGEVANSSEKLGFDFNEDVLEDRDAKVRDRIKIVNVDDHLYWNGSVGTVVDTYAEGHVWVNFDNGDFDPQMASGKNILVVRDEYKVIV